MKLTIYFVLQKGGFLMGNYFKRMSENRKSGKRAFKGFTLVEIIVVLVIIAILAAAMIPALTGYIDKAKEKTVITEARSVLTAAQTIASEKYAVSSSVKVTAADVQSLSEVSGTISDITVDSGKVTKFKYDNDVYTVTYDSSAEEKFSIEKKSGK